MRLLHVWCPVALCLVLRISATSSLQWTDSLPDQTVVNTCVGRNVFFNWTFTLANGETVEDIKWYHADSRSNQLIGIYGANNFVVMPTFSGRVRHAGGAAIWLDHVTALDKGNYSVEAVSVHHGSGTFSTIRRMASLQVAELPPSVRGNLTVTQDRDAVLNNVGTTHVQLTCSSFTDLGQPPISVVWKTPSGAVLSSTSYYSGKFHLVLDNPVTGGDYSCLISPDSSAAACLHSDDPLRRESTLQVDEIKARLTLVEASQGTASRKEAETLAEVTKLKNLVTELEAQNANLTQITGNLTSYAHSLESLIATATPHVSFHARLTTSKVVAASQPLILERVLTNEGGAYNSTTGVFTVPVNGTYFLAATIAPNDPGAVEGDLMVDDEQVCHAYSVWSSNTHMSTCHVAVFLSKGQRVTLNGVSGNFWSDGTFFTGILINAE